jgi:hypothetical protein
MIRAGLAAMIVLAFGGAADQHARPRSAPSPQFRGSVTFHEQIIVRIPRGAHGAAAANPMVQWREHRGPHCVDISDIAGAALMGPDSFDLALRDGTRVRARLESSCPALDYYRGFYVHTTNDGRICADRDVVRSRAGGECRIDTFRTLRPVRR